MRIVQRAKSYTKSLLSRFIPRLIASHGVIVKVSAEAKAVRRLSCHGDAGLAPCSHRRSSERFEQSHYCGACGCGDRRNVLLDGAVPPYEKLDYPYLGCPVNMPGFTTYTPASADEKPDARKVALEERYGVATFQRMVEKQKRFVKPQEMLRNLVKRMR